MRSAGLAAFVAAPLLVLTSIWFPVWRYYHVAEPVPAAAVVQTLRREPSAARLAAVDRQAQALRLVLSEAEVLPQAEAIVRGRLRLPDGELRTVSWPFDAHDFDSGSPGGALNMASLAVPDTLLRAYELSGNPAYLERATQALVAFIDFEAGLQTDLGNVRNDHAIASRMGVLIRFWRHYRDRPGADEAVIRAVFRHAARCAEFLAKPNFFTVATNHGVMQNIALLQAAAAFPSLPGVAEGARIARQRLAEQMAFFANGEGVVLEHAPGYHRFGVQLMEMIRQLLDWTGLPPIDGLAEKAARGQLFLQRLTRPDGSLPRIGDTNGEPSTEIPAVPAGVADPAVPLPDATRVYPGAGYALTQRAIAVPDGAKPALSHATLAWGRFPKHGHEVAAEGSFLLWAAGTDWIGNTGYWPYGAPGRNEAESWRGSNAPHLRGEPFASRGASVLRAIGADARSHLLDYARTIPGQTGLRRQVLQVDDRTWVVLDAVSGPVARPVDRVWTLPPRAQVEGTAAGLLAKDLATGWTLQVEVLGDRTPALQPLRQSLEPFGGWAVTDSRPVPAPALEVAMPPGASWVATVFSLLPPEATPLVRPVIRYGGADDWTVMIDPGRPTAVETRRRGETVSVGTPGVPGRQFELVEPASPFLAERPAIRDALEAALAKYPRFQPHVFYRLRLSTLILVAAAASGLAWLWLKRQRPRASWPGIAAASVLWGVIAGWTHLVYFAR